MQKLLKGVILLILCLANSSYAEEPANLEELHKTIVCKRKHCKRQCSIPCVNTVPGPQGPQGFPGLPGLPGIPTARVFAYGYASRTTGGAIGSAALVTYDTFSTTGTNVTIDPVTGIATVLVAGDYLIKFALSVDVPTGLGTTGSYSTNVLVNGDPVFGSFFTNLNLGLPMSSSFAGQIIYALAAGDQVAILNTSVDVILIPTTIPLFSTGSNITAYLSLEKIN